MNSRWIALGVAGFAVWLVATFGVVYAAVELAEDDVPVVAEAPGVVDAPGPTIDPRCIAALESAGTATFERGGAGPTVKEYVDEFCGLLGPGEFKP